MDTNLLPIKYFEPARHMYTEVQRLNNGILISQPLDPFPQAQALLQSKRSKRRYYHRYQYHQFFGE